MARDNRNTFWEAVDQIRLMDDRLQPQAYAFVMESLDFTLRNIGERRHVSARELLDGACAYARTRFGLLAADVLENWGVTRPSDIGRAVFQMVDAGVLMRQESDSIRDFDIEYDLKRRLEVDYFK